MDIITDAFIKYWVQAACAVLAGIIGWMWKNFNDRFKHDHEEQKAIKGAILAMLRDRIYQSCTFYLSRGDITLREREVQEAMFTEYFHLGGNGVVKHLKGEIDALQTKAE